jgi:hypothetical protein
MIAKADGVSVDYPRPVVLATLLAAIADPAFETELGILARSTAELHPECRDFPWMAEITHDNDPAAYLATIALAQTAASVARETRVRAERERSKALAADKIAKEQAARAQAARDRQRSESNIVARAPEVFRRFIAEMQQRNFPGAREYRVVRNPSKRTFTREIAKAKALEDSARIFGWEMLGIKPRGRAQRHKFAQYQKLKSAGGSAVLKREACKSLAKRGKPLRGWIVLTQTFDYKDSPWDLWSKTRTSSTVLLEDGTLRELFDASNGIVSDKKESIPLEDIALALVRIAKSEGITL